MAEATEPVSLLTQLKTYRPEHGRYTRLATFWSLVVLWGYGCFRLDETLADLRYSWSQFLRTKIVEELPLLENPLKWSTIVAILVFAAGVAAIQYFLNKPKVAELLIDTEGELKKVNWPTAKETTSASTIVLVTVIALFVLLGAYDLILGNLFDFIFLGQQ